MSCCYVYSMLLLFSTDMIHVWVITSRNCTKELSSAHLFLVVCVVTYVVTYWFVCTTPTYPAGRRGLDAGATAGKQQKLRPWERSCSQ